MLQVEHSAILLTFIKLPFVIKILVLSIFEWPLYYTQGLLYVQISLINAHAELSSGAKGLNFGLSLHLPVYFVFMGES